LPKIADSIANKKLIWQKKWLLEKVEVLKHY